MRPFILFLFIVHSGILISSECITPKSNTEIEKLSNLFGNSSCNPLDKSTWNENWKGPCECIHKKKEHSKLITGDRNSKEKVDFEIISNSMEVRVAEIIKTELFNQIEQSLKLDIYLKKGAVESGKVEIPSSCRLSKAGSLLDDLEKKIENKKLLFKCDKELYQKRKELIFDKKGFSSWRNEREKLLEKTVTNQLSKKDRDAGLCLPYKSYLSLTGTNPLRTTYLKVALSFGDNYSGFLNWANDRSRPDDSMEEIAKYNFNKFTNTLSPKTAQVQQNLRKSNQAEIIKNFSSDEIRKNLNSKVEAITTEDIVQLIKTDPVFERMIKDPSFYKTLIDKKDDLVLISDSDIGIINLIARSQNTSCENLYGNIKTLKSMQKSGSSGRDSNVTSNINDQSLMTRFLCDENFIKEFMDTNTISNEYSKHFQRRLRLASKEDAEIVLTDYLYCKGDNEKKINLDDFTYPLSKNMNMEIPKENNLKNMLNQNLNPQSELRLMDVPNKKTAYKKFNDNICKYIDESCKNDNGAADSSNCQIANISNSVGNKILNAKLNNSSLAKSQIETVKNAFHDTGVSDKALRNNMQKAESFSKEEIDTIVLLRQQTKPFIKLTNNGHKLNSAKESKKLVESYSVTNEPLVSDNLFKENDNNESSSLYSNYFALGSCDDEISLDKNKDRNLCENDSESIKLKNKLDEENVLNPIKRDQLVAAKSFVAGSTVAWPRNFKESPDINISGQTEVSSSDAPFIYKRKSFNSSDNKMKSADTILVNNSVNLNNKNPAEDVIVEKSEVIKDMGGITLNTTDQKIENSVMGGKFNSENKLIPNLTKIKTSTNVENGFYDSSYTNQKITKTNNQVSLNDDKLKDDLKRKIESLDKRALELENMNYSRKMSENDNEIKKLQDELKKESQSISNKSKIDNIQKSIKRTTNTRQIVSNNVSENNSNVEKGNYANEYDPMDRVNTGKRVVSDVVSRPSQKINAKDSFEKNTTSDKAQIKSDNAKEIDGPAGSTPASLASSGGDIRNGASSGPAIRLKGSRYPTLANGESDPDDVCGYEKELECLFEHQSTQYSSVFVDSIPNFVQALGLYGKSFRTLEVYKYKNDKMPRKYFIRYFEPNINLSELDKIEIHKQANVLMKDYSKNKKELKEHSQLFVQVKMIEISKVEARDISKKVLRLEDIKILQNRRSREL